MPAMQVYLVGGAVRDEMLGLAIGERDWVVVGATPAELTRAGYRPVGRDFPVFLHPESNEEYALARLERKTAPGYRGFVTEFSPSVTLEQDLARRDLTINAMARAADGTLIDPHGGERDLAARVLRHVSPAFIEDPVRILRLARFAARFAPLGFVIAPDTMTLMQRMVADGEAAALVPERVWQELVRALGEAQPARFFGVLRDCGALHVILPEIDDAVEEEAASIAGGARCGENPLAEEPAPALAPGAPPPVGALAALRAAVRRGERGTVRFATLLAGLPIEDIESLCTRLKAPSEYRELALLAARSGSYLHAAGVPPPVAAQDPEWLLGLLEHADAFRRAERFNDWLAILSTRAMAGGVPSGAALAFSAALHARREQLMAVKLPADTLLAGAEYGAALRLARLEALRALARSAPLAAPPT